MDLTSLAEIAGAVAVPLAGLLMNKAIELGRQRLHLDISAQTAAEIDKAAEAGAGMLTARLAAGKMDLSHVSLGNQNVDDAVTVAMNVAGQAAVDAGLTRDVLAGKIVGLVGNAIGEDPTVPTVPAVPAVPATKPAA